MLTGGHKLKVKINDTLELETTNPDNLRKLLVLILSENSDLIGVVTEVAIRYQELHRKELKEQLNQLRNVIQYTSGAVAHSPEVTSTEKIKEAIASLYQNALDSGALTKLSSNDELDLIEALDLKI